MKMGEIKSVKVDNWGVFFLQKLQNFFNKTDYCDLTLQFRDNSQLKVHRLVLSACTDYFNVLEQTCEVVDDAIIMPNELQADVVVPIVNFMYTGTLEFELRMYNRLLRTAREMNMTVLLKLLEAHRRTMELHPQKNQGTASPKLRRRVVQNTNNAQFKSYDNISSSPTGRLPTAPSNAIAVQRRIVPVSSNNNRVNQNTSTSGTLVRQSGTMSSSTVSYTRIKQENVDYDVNVIPTGEYTDLKKSPQYQQQSPIAITSPFEQLRKSYNNNKRPTAATFISPPAKKPNLEDVKEFAEQQRMRKQIAAEYGEADGDYDSALMDDDIHNDDDDDDVTGNQTAGQTSLPPSNTHTSSASVQTLTTSNKASTIDPPGTTTITVRHEGPDKPPTIVVKDSSNSKMNHAKIISEVLRQYPHLIKSNKNIKLKIMPSPASTNNSNIQKIIVKKEAGGETEKSNVQQQITKVHQVTDQTIIKAEGASSKGNNVQLQKHTISNNMQQQVKSVKTTSSNISGEMSSTSKVVQQPQKRRIDSKTMHALISLGAENIAGPWLCLRCGRNGHPISIPSYRGFRRHLINTHKETIDPALCEYCGWRSNSKRELHYHMQLEHKVKTTLYIFPECQLCSQMCIDSDALNQHLIDSHPDENKQQCIYCNKIFPEEMQLYTHMKTFHKKQALEDGIIDYSDDEAANQQEQQNLYHELMGEFSSPTEDRGNHVEEEKIKILSDISLPSAKAMIKQEQANIAETVATSNAVVTTSAEAYIQHDTETKFVTADGNEVILTDEQRKDILSQLHQEHEGGGVVMVLNEQQSEQLSALGHDETSQATTETTNNDEPMEEDDRHVYHEIKLQTELTTTNVEEGDQDEEEEQGGDEAEIIREEEDAHAETNEEVRHNKTVTPLDESKESLDNLEWAENLISEHELADNVATAVDDNESKDTNNKNDVNNKGEKERPIIDEKERKSEKMRCPDEISKKLKELTGDWSDDDLDDEEEENDEISENDKVERSSNERSDSKQHTPKTISSVLKDVKYVTEKVTDDNVKDNLIKSMKDEEYQVKEEKPKVIVNSCDDVGAEEEDDIDLALKTLHKEEQTKSTENFKDHKIADEINNEQVKETSKITSSEHIHEGNEKFDDIDDESDVVEKDRKTAEKVRARSPKQLDEAAKKDLIEMLLNNTEICADTPIMTTINTTTITTTTVSSNGAANNSCRITLKEEETELNLSAITEIEPNPGYKEEFVTKEEPPFLNEHKKHVRDTTECNAPAVTASIKESNPGTTPSTEDRVKNLMSEWGEDEDDEVGDNTETILTKDL